MMLSLSKNSSLDRWMVHMEHFTYKLIQQLLCSSPSPTLLAWFGGYVQAEQSGFAGSVDVICPTPTRLGAICPETSFQLAAYNHTGCCVMCTWRMCLGAGVEGSLKITPILLLLLIHPITVPRKARGGWE